MNVIFFAIVLIAFVVAAFRQVTWEAPDADAQSPMEILGIGMSTATTPGPS